MSESICYRAFQSAVLAVGSAELVKQCIRLSGSLLYVGNLSYQLTGRLVIMAIGKASLGMLRSLYDILHIKMDLAICCLPEYAGDDEDGNYAQLMGIGESSFMQNPRVKLFFGDRSNLPNQEVVKGSELAYQTALSLTADDLLLVALTGGGSALLTLPKQFHNERLTLDDLVHTTKLVSSAGADIQQLNAVRSCLDELKAGGLALAAYPAKVVSLIVSDVIGDPIQYIASGPTFIEASTTQSQRVQRCVEILRHHDVWDKVPEKIREYLESELSESNSRETRHPRVTNLVIGNNMVALNSAAKSVETETLISNSESQGRYVLPIILTNEFCGDATENGRLLAELLWYTARYILKLLENDSHSLAVVPKEAGRSDEKLQELLAQLAKTATASGNNLAQTSLILNACLQVASALAKAPKNAYGGIVFLLGGEATVVVPHKINSNTSVEGGRCSHLALSAAIRWFELMQGCESPTSVDIGLLAGASDGLDGPAARGGGMWVSASDTVCTENTYREAKEELRRCNSYGFFRKNHTGTTLPARLTNTNVMDLLIGHHDSLFVCVTVVHWILGEMAQWLEREFTDRIVPGSNPTSASRLPLSRLGRPGNIPALVFPSGGMAARHPRNATAKWLDPHLKRRQTSEQLSLLVIAFILRCQLIRSSSKCIKWHTEHVTKPAQLMQCDGGEMVQWLEREYTDRKIRGSNSTSASRLPLSRRGQYPSPRDPSGGMAARHRKGAIAE
ncbi:Glycerate kinase [Clonorchis sinensis]|uniref:Glycerate kinase n=1 Tax=Clonorchis sinensis TaxID=79923 RepID=A0A8T1MU37_CLOSI|nr:Glycerate kinase [Clonorchis sinensis]